MQKRWQIVQLFKSSTILLAAFIRADSGTRLNDEALNRSLQILLNN